MSLSNIAAAVKRNPLPQRIITVNREPVPVVNSNVQSNGSEAVGRTVLPIIEAPSDPVPKQSYGGTSITGIAREIEASKGLHVVSDKEIVWENCKCLKRAADKLFCTKFLRYCVKEKCPKKYIEV